MASKGKNIREDIETTADYYDPFIYERLTYFHNLSLKPDGLGEQFFPLSTVPYRFGETQGTGKIFVVGLIPPSNKVTGRSLDRSASIAAITESSGGGPTSSGGTTASDTVGGGVQGGGGVTGNSGGGSRTGIVTYPGYTLPNSSADPSIIKGNLQSVNLGEGTGELYKDTTKKGSSPNSELASNNSIRNIYAGVVSTYTGIYNHPPTAVEAQILTAQIMRETSGAWPGNNPGYISGPPGKGISMIEPSASKPGEKVTRYYRAYATAEAGLEAFIRKAGQNPNVLEAARQGDVLGYCTSQAQQGYFTASTKYYYDTMVANARTDKSSGKVIGYDKPGTGILSQIARAVPELGLNDGSGIPMAPTSCAFTETTGEYQKRVKGKVKGKNSNWRFNVMDAYGSQCSMENTTQASTNWQSNGAPNAQQAKKESERVSGIDLNKSDLGQLLQTKQADEIRWTLFALDVMRSTPPLRLLVNPSSFRVSCEKVTSEGNWTRTGPVIEHWGEDQDKIEGSGKIAGFFAVDATNIAIPGLSRTTRNYSYSYRNFLSLWMLYRNNGGLYLPDKGDINVLSLMGSIYIYYDGIMYIGKFETFNITENDSAPHNLEYSFSFSVRAWFLLDPAGDILGTARTSPMRTQPPSQITSQSYDSSPSADTLAMQQIDKAFVAGEKQAAAGGVREIEFGDYG